MSNTDVPGEKTVQKSAYRQPVTPEGLKAIEAGTLTWLDDEMYNNLNSGVLEQYRRPRRAIVLPGSLGPVLILQTSTQKMLRFFNVLLMFFEVGFTTSPLKLVYYVKKRS